MIPAVHYRIPGNTSTGGYWVIPRSPEKPILSATAFSITSFVYVLKPIISEKLPNEITRMTFEDTDAGRNLTYCEDEKDFFKKLYD